MAWEDYACADVKFPNSIFRRAAHLLAAGLRTGVCRRQHRCTMGVAKRPQNRRNCGCFEPALTNTPYKFVPDTSPAAYAAAEQTLKSGHFTFSDDEVDSFLPTDFGRRSRSTESSANAVLNAVGNLLAVQSENAITSIARTRPIKTLSFLFSSDGQFPKSALLCKSRI